MKKRIKSLTNLSMKVKFIDGCTAVQIMVVNNTTDETFISVVPIDFDESKFSKVNSKTPKTESEESEQVDEGEQDSEEVVNND